MESDRRRSLERAACGIVTAGARFIPVPLLDDAVADRATRFAVRRTLTARGLDASPDLVEPLVDPDGLKHGVLRAVAAVPRKVLLFPVRKYVAIARTLRSGPKDVLAVVLLCRSLDRALDRGQLTSSDPAVLRAQALDVRRAYDDAFRNADLRILAGALADGLDGVRGLAKAALETGRRVLDRDAGDDAVEAALDSALNRAPDPAGTADARTTPVRQGAEAVDEVLRRPEVVARLEEFDADFDGRLARRQAPRAG